MLKKLLCALTLLALPLPLLADEKEKAAPLTPKEIAEGWISLFDGESLFGWKQTEGAKWAVVDGMLYPEAGSSGALVSTCPFADFDLVAEYRVSEQAAARLLLGCDESGKNGSLVNSGFDRLSGDWTRVRFSVRGSHITEASWETLGAGARTGKGMKAGGPPTAVHKGHLALTGNGVIIRQFKLRPMNLKPFFNGKDLTGWKEHPGKKSKFSVTDDGCIHLKDGPGDLQSEEQWADFVLQIECKSNGDYLNSGVFFRCIPGEYQNGYECQIHNKFAAEPAKEYTIEEYDPKSHELTGKKKVKYAAADYGTGAIYRRMPARKPMSKDREWFTMTIVADGRHLATWVNGYQEVDWTDNRPANKNPRNGAKVEKGPISLQGHDATTDLLFRNIRIAELTK